VRIWRDGTAVAGRHPTYPRPAAFHPTHGGVATSGKIKFDPLNAEHREIFGWDYWPPVYDALYHGQIRPEAMHACEPS
jgi:hypothetical protein